MELGLAGASVYPYGIAGTSMDEKMCPYNTPYAKYIDHWLLLNLSFPSELEGHQVENFGWMTELIN